MKQLNILSFISKEAITSLSDEDKSTLLSFLISFNDGKYDASMIPCGCNNLSLIISMAIHSYNVVFGECDLSGQNPKIEVETKTIEVVKSELTESIEKGYDEIPANGQDEKSETIVDQPELPLHDNHHSDNDWYKSKEYFHDVRKMWNKICISLPEVVKYGKNISSGLIARTREMELSTRDDAMKFYEELFNTIQGSDYLTGKCKNWSASFDWVFCHPTNFTNILNGKYRNGNYRKSDSNNPRKNFGTYKPNGNIKVDTGSETLEDMAGFDFSDFEK